VRLRAMQALGNLANFGTQQLSIGKRFERTARLLGPAETVVVTRRMRTTVKASEIDEINPRVASVKPSKTMALADLASSLKAEGVDVISLAAGEPDFNTPQPIVEAGIEALQRGITRYVKGRRWPVC
jgi:hypothetical protein